MEVSKEKIAKVDSVALDKKSREIIIVCSAKGSMFIQEPKEYGFPSLINGSVIVDGLNLIFQGGYESVNLLKQTKTTPQSVEMSLEGNTTAVELLAEIDVCRALRMPNQAIKYIEAYVSQFKAKAEQLEKENERLREVINVVRNYISSKSPEGHEVITILEQALQSTETKD